MREKIRFLHTFEPGTKHEQFCTITAWKCRNGLAVGHPVKIDQGILGYKTGWIVYNVESGEVLKTALNGKSHKTPAKAMSFVRREVKGLLSNLKTRKFDKPICDCPAEIVGKLKAFPKDNQNTEKPRFGCERVDAKKFSAFINLIDQIDSARREAYRTSEKQVTFTIARSKFTVGASLESLNKFRANVIKNRKAFADTAFQLNPSIAKTSEKQLQQADALPKTLSEYRKNELSIKAQESIARIMECVIYDLP